MDDTVEKRSGGSFRWGPVVLVAVALSFYFIVSRPPPAPAGWGEDFVAAVRQANAEGKKLIVDFYSDGCPPCAAMDRFVLPSREVQDALRDFVPVRVNVVRDSRTAALFGVAGTPTFVVVSPDGKPLGRIDGYVEPQLFVGFLREASARAAERPSATPAEPVNPSSSPP